MNKWSKLKALEDNSRRRSSRWPFVFYNLREKCYWKSWKYMRNNSTRQEDLNFTILKFRVQRCGDMWPKKGWKALKRKKMVHTSCRHCIKRICQLCTKGRPAGKLTWYEHFRDLLDYCWWDNRQRSSPQNTGRAKTARFAWKNVNLDTLWELEHSIPDRNIKKLQGMKVQLG